MKNVQIIIPNRMEGERIDIALAKMLPEFSRSKITAWIKSGEAVIYGKKFKPKDKVSGDEVIILSANRNQNTIWLAENIPIMLFTFLRVSGILNLLSG